MRYRFLSAAILVFATLGVAAGAEDQHFDSAGVKIRYVTAGKGETVVLIHGFAASVEVNWDFPGVMAALAREYRVVALDCRGHGKSDRPHDAKKYGPEMVKDVVRLLDHLKVKKAHVVGYSMGAALAGELLVSHPDRLLSVTFGGGAPSLPHNKEGGAILEATIASLAKGEGMVPLVIALSAPGKRKPSEASARTFSDLILAGQDQKALAAVLRGAKNSAVTDAKLMANRLPVCFVYGSRESGWIAEWIATRRKMFPRATVKVVEGGDHISTIARPEFRKAILDFLHAQKK